ncbi:leucyl aminopeptidase [Aquipuribacter nitratireducens]|uniref:Probable cytosol aminopeptidase n=1 Tax=Aquipuribacter nitratireducens TaxID=650104 RepID=A0ABW0GJJ4_9MICO
MSPATAPHPTVPTAALTTKKLSAVEADAAVVGMVSTSDGAAVAVDDLPSDSVHALEAAAAALDFTGSASTTLRLPGVEGLEVDQVVLVGLGSTDDEDAPSTDVLRRAAGAAVRAVSKASTVLVVLPSEGAEQVRAVTEGALLGGYRFTAYKSGLAKGATRDSAGKGSKDDDGRTKGVREVLVHAGGRRDKATKSALEQGVVTAEAVALARDLVNTPPLDLHPGTLADRAEEAVRSLPVKASVLDEKQLARKGYGGILAVGQGSSRPPRLVTLSYSPSRAKAHVALVGKGITFDTGGISLKPPASMPGMKADMAGAAAVLATVVAAARLQLPVAVTGYLALAENMPGGGAQRPSDVITMYGGRTVEVLNTDAEGRLVMADAIVTATELSPRPDALVDVATLTGAQVVALGSRVSGVMGNDDALRSEVVANADVAGEEMWPMPLPEHLRPTMDSTVADIANISSKRDAGMLTAGVFLKEFVPTGGEDHLPWAHVDIAGPGFNEGGAFDHVHKGGTGAAVATLVRLLENRSA